MTDFQKRVYEALNLIPKGKVTTYKEIAKYLKTKAYQAIGTAIAKNPYAPNVPCHRVVPSSGKIGNYSAKGGVKAKIELLTREGVKVKEGKIVDFKNILFKYSGD